MTTLKAGDVRSSSSKMLISRKGGMCWTSLLWRLLFTLPFLTTSCAHNEATPDKAIVYSGPTGGKRGATMISISPPAIADPNKPTLRREEPSPNPNSGEKGRTHSQEFATRLDAWAFYATNLFTPSELRSFGLTASDNDLPQNITIEAKTKISGNNAHVIIFHSGCHNGSLTRNIGHRVECVKEGMAQYSSVVFDLPIKQCIPASNFAERMRYYGWTIILPSVSEKSMQIGPGSVPRSEIVMARENGSLMTISPARDCAIILETVTPF